MRLPPDTFRVTAAGSPRLVRLSFQMIDLLAQPIVLSLEAIVLALRLVALALGAFRPFSQVFDLTSGPIVPRMGRVIHASVMPESSPTQRCIAVPLCELDSASVSRWAASSRWAA